MYSGTVYYKKKLVVVALMLLAWPATGQQTSEPSAEPKPQSVPELTPESPADLYLRAMQPVEIVRRSPNNITDSEMAAWGVAVSAAAHACAERKIEEFKGEDLFHFARLCQLGQQYEDAYVIARNYVNGGNTQSLESARALMLRASLSGNNLVRAERAALELLHNHPYDGTVHTLIQETIMTLASVDAAENALRFVDERRDGLMNALRAGGGLPLHEGSYRVPQSTLVRDALSAVYLYRLETRMPEAPVLARTLLDSIRQAVADTGTSVPPLEREAMQAALRRAELLTTDAPVVSVAAASMAKPPLTAISYEGRVTLLAFYAPWSPQRAQMFELLANLARDYKTFPVQIFALSTPTVATGDATAKALDVLARLLEPFGKTASPVPLVVAADSANQEFAIDDWPMFAVIDTQGKLRFLDTLTGPEYKDGGRMHRLVAGLASQAGPLPTPPAVKTKSGRVKVPEGTLQRRPK